MNSGGGRERVASASERVYRALMLAYPQEVRWRYADEMVGYFGELCREERLGRGAVGVALLWARTLPELFFTALEERGAAFRRNAYLPVSPRIVARWGALCAILGGSFGADFYLLNNYSLLGTPNILTGGSYGHDPFSMFFTLSMPLSALSLSSMGLFGLYGAVVARSGRPGLLAGAGAAFSSASVALWLVTSGYSAVDQLASGTPLFAPFEWLRETGTFVIGKAILFWFLGLLLLALAAARQPLLPNRLRVLPLAVFALVALGYLLKDIAYAGGNPVTAAIVAGFVQSLPFVGIALLGWVLLTADDSEPRAVPAGSLEGVEISRGTARPAGRDTSQARRVARADTVGSAAEAAKEKELLEAFGRRGRLTVAGIALETSLSVEEADRMLASLAAKGHLEVSVEHGRLLYSLWSGDE